MNRVTRKELTDAVSVAVRVKRGTVRRVLAAALDQIIAELARGRSVELRDFGVFSVTARKPRNWRNPVTGTTGTAPERHVVRFKVGKRPRQLLRFPK